MVSSGQMFAYNILYIIDQALSAWASVSDHFSGSARDLICTHFTDGMSELTIAYILLGMLRALEYIHHMGYVHR